MSSEKGRGDISASGFSSFGSALTYERPSGIKSPTCFSTKIGRKLVPPLTVDLGQGILRVMEEEHRAINANIAEEAGYLLPE